MATSGIFVLCVLIPVVICETFNETSNPEYTGLLTPACISSYYRTHVSKWVPPREYQYFHEVASPEQLSRTHDENELRFRIVGGNKITIEDVPYQVMYGKYCGGSLIAPEWVITAAHCNPKGTHVYVGSTLRNHAVPYKICAQFNHPLWNSPEKLHFHDYDYRLILLEKPVPINNVSRPIAIGSVNDIQPGVMVSVSGWGYLSYRKYKMEDHLRQVHIPIMSHDVCRSSPSDSYHTITQRMFCAGLVGGKKDSCQGDSGGPAMVNGKLVGLVSFGVGCAQEKHPGVYSNIPLVRSWIREVTGLPL